MRKCSFETVHGIAMWVICIVCFMGMGFNCEEDRVAREYRHRNSREGMWDNIQKSVEPNYPHELRRMRERTKSEYKSSASGSFFLIIGNYSATAKGDQKFLVQFAWKAYDGTYIMSSLPLERVRVRVNSRAKIPQITFYTVDYSTFNSSIHTSSPEFDSRLRDTKEMASKFEYVAYAVVECTDDQWYPNVELPLSDK